MTRNITRISKPVGIGLALLLLVGLVSCTDNFDAVNTPQNQIVAESLDDALLGQMFSYAQFQTMSAFRYLWHENLYADRFAQYFSTIHPAFQSGQFEEAGVHTASSWQAFYDRVSPQLGFVEEFTADNGMAVENAIAKIWRVQAYQRAATNWGPIAYSNVNSGETSVPYDAEEDIYMDFFQTLDEAIAVLEQNRGGTAFGPHDQMYGGNVDQWIEFANSLRLRLAMRIVYVEPGIAQNEAEKAVAAGVITSNANSADLSTTVNSLNPLSTITYHEEFRVSSALHSVLVGYDDPRLPVYFAEVWDGGGYKGLRNGLPSAQRDRGLMTLTYSSLGNRWRPLFSGAWGDPGVNAPVRVLSAAEVYFLRAEGALRGWDMGGTPVELYNEGIRMSLTEDRIGASQADIDAYITSTALPVGIDDPWDTPPMTDIPVLWDVVAEATNNFERNLEQIITQKWLALYPDGWEAWAERRRTGYPVGYAIITSLNPDLSETELFRRVKFSSDDRSDNSAAVQAAEALLGPGGDSNATRLWWDKKPITDFPVPAGAQ